MAYSLSLKRNFSFKDSYIGFVIRLVFSVIMILLLLYAGFYFTFLLLGLVFFISVLGSIFYNKFPGKVRHFLQMFEFDYERGFFGKSFFMSLLAIITSFVVIWLLGYSISYNKEFIAIIGFVILGIGNNLVVFLLSFKKNQFIIYGTTLEFFVLSILINTLLLYFMGLPLIISLYFAVSLNIFYILPWLDHNLTTLLLVTILYILLYL